jgi:hypothetical protein
VSKIMVDHSHQQTDTCIEKVNWHIGQAHIRVRSDVDCVFIQVEAQAVHYFSRHGIN